MPNHSNWYLVFRRIGRVTLVVLKVIILFLEVIKRSLDLS